MRLVARIRALVHHVGCLLKDVSSVPLIFLEMTLHPQVGLDLEPNKYAKLRKAALLGQVSIFIFVSNHKIYLRVRVFIDMEPLQQVEKTLHTVPSPTMQNAKVFAQKGPYSAAIIITVGLV